jgi:hypothetical protein
MTWMPSDAAPEVSEAFARLLNTFDEAHADEDAPGSEPPKVIIVTEAGGREVRYRADWTDTEDGNLQVIREDQGAITVAQYARGYYKRAYREDALLSDDVSRLGIAKRALREIAETKFADPQDFGDRARQALADIAELDL